MDADIDPREYEEADFKKFVLILGILTVHSFPEGTAISIPLKSMDVSEWKMVWWAVFSSLPQPVGAVIAFASVRIAREFLPFGFGFAAGAMISLVLTEFILEALDVGKELPGGGKRELMGGIAVGIAIMVPLAFVCAGTGSHSSDATLETTFDLTPSDASDGSDPHRPLSIPVSGACQPPPHGVRPRPATLAVGP